MNNNEIMKLYKEIFDDEGNVRPVGREKCKELIKILSEANKDIDFGNVSTGFMNTDNIKNYLNLK